MEQKKLKQAHQKLPELKMNSIIQAKQKRGRILASIYHNYHQPGFCCCMYVYEIPGNFLLYTIKIFVSQKISDQKLN